MKLETETCIGKVLERSGAAGLRSPNLQIKSVVQETKSSTLPGVINFAYPKHRSHKVCKFYDTVARPCDPGAG